jgi:hypothetical protein
VAYASAPDLLVLHALRLAGMADCAAVARRFSLDASVVEEQLLDDESRGWVQRVRFADLRAWSLTIAGRLEGERLLAEELDRSGARDEVAGAHTHFLPLNTRFLRAVTDWQLRSEPLERLVPNDHTDPRWDDRVLATVRSVGRSLESIDDRLSATLDRFTGYSARFTSALAQVERGRLTWLDEPAIASCHTVWFQLHEDLLATLAIERGCED